MSGVPEKARFFLERAVPQLREFEAKGIFSPEEIRNLVRKRTDFEHLVLSPGNKPQDWLNYAAWEKSLESLRAKRCRRLQIRNSTTHAGTGRIFSILERAVNRHPADVNLWKEYLTYANALKATKRYRKIMTRALRMHPAKPDLWTMAGRRSAANSDMQGARNFFMRGTRFCARDATVWLEYARCEMEWLQKMEARKSKKGGAEKAIKEQAEQTDDMIEFEEDDSDNDDGQLVIPDPDRTAGNKKVISAAEEEKLKNNPALDGAIPLAIFDISRKQPFFKPATAEQFFFVFADFSNVSSQQRLLQHVLDTMTTEFPNDPSTAFCYIRQPLIGLQPSSSAYAKALQQALPRLRAALADSTNQLQLADKITLWIQPVLALEDLDDSVRIVLQHTLDTLPKS
ncbi:U3 small nucleolar RNA-associated protein 6-domain-containing protein [Microdochium trichocladiopsis]|uniref:U3 small nucleolar RNA-associated protein 6-domain-containing protein n=1 Tax=Microdochium trichocladiopsis TaxID=1682393 RepID=A0A9P8Y5M1_9PEZI|nr:U3 small nucleolar RNA-associated protein 6-domain-containing protein [Microdochium trichocladiopsis]KAH7028873.1 U3 small nucleolar RNA-associated protein 6-domain-containing protein [Microdochium trichocladiopsis]